MGDHDQPRRAGFHDSPRRVSTDNRGRTKLASLGQSARSGLALRQRSIESDPLQVSTNGGVASLPLILRKSIGVSSPAVYDERKDWRTKESSGWRMSPTEEPMRAMRR